MRVTIPLPDGVTGTPDVSAYTEAGAPVFGSYDTSTFPIGCLRDVRAEPGAISGDLVLTPEAEAQVRASLSPVGWSFSSSARAGEPPGFGYVVAEWGWVALLDGAVGFVTAARPASAARRTATFTYANGTNPTEVALAELVRVVTDVNDGTYLLTVDSAYVHVIRGVWEAEPKGRQVAIVQGLKEAGLLGAVGAVVLRDLGDRFVWEQG